MPVNLVKYTEIYLLIIDRITDITASCKLVSKGCGLLIFTDYMHFSVRCSSIEVGGKGMQLTCSKEQFAY